MALINPEKMQYESGHPRVCMVTFSVALPSLNENSHIMKSPEKSRHLTLGRIRDCVQRIIDAWQLTDNEDTFAKAVCSDRFPLMIPTPARENMPLKKTLRGIM